MNEVPSTSDLWLQVLFFGIMEMPDGISDALAVLFCVRLGLCDPSKILLPNIKSRDSTYHLGTGKLVGGEEHRLHVTESGRAVETDRMSPC